VQRQPARLRRARENMVLFVAALPQKQHHRSGSGAKLRALQLLWQSYSIM
jgi:hypothetical protein